MSKCSTLILYPAYCADVGWYFLLVLFQVHCLDVSLAPIGANSVPTSVLVCSSVPADPDRTCTSCFQLRSTQRKRSWPCVHIMLRPVSA